MSVRTRLLAAFGLVTVIVLVPGVFAVSRLTQLGDIATEGRMNHAVAVTSLGRMQRLITDLDRLQRSYVATGDDALGAKAAARTDSLGTLFEAFRASPYGHVGTELAPVLDDIATLSAEVDTEVRQGRVEEATARFDDLLQRFGLAERGLQTMADSIDHQAGAELARVDRMTRLAREQTLFGLGLALALALVFTGLTTHWLTAPLRRLARAMAAVADGTLRPPEDLPYHRSDEIGDLAVSFELMTRELEALDRKKSEFLGMVSHELKTPINVINAYAEILRDDLDTLPEYHRDMIVAVGDQSREMARRVSRLMDLSRLEAGTYQLQFEPVALKPFMSDLHSTFRRLAEDKAIALEMETCEAVPTDVVMDGDVIRDEVLGNLILNAIRHTPEGGRIRVRLDTDERGVGFAVADTGPGIPEEHRAHIFQKHYVADRARAVGSGLGLAIAKEMVELHGGLITLEDPVTGWGARFRVSLPLKPQGLDVEIPAPSLVGPRAPGAERVA